jgi:hypothetical protein
MTRELYRYNFFPTVPLADIEASLLTVQERVRHLRRCCRDTGLKEYL